MTFVLIVTGATLAILAILGIIDRYGALPSEPIEAADLTGYGGLTPDEMAEWHALCYAAARTPSVDTEHDMVRIPGEVLRRDHDWMRRAAAAMAAVLRLDILEDLDDDTDDLLNELRRLVAEEYDDGEDDDDDI